MKKVCVIPARMASSRFPGKPMKPILGLPMINHIFRRCRLARSMDEVIVATCDQEIFDSISADHGRAVMTKDSHERCTDRVSEALENARLDLRADDFVLMVQGDEIFVTPEMIDDMSSIYDRERPEAVNLISQLHTREDIHSPHTVKVVTATDDRILYMSRSPIPSPERAKNATYYQQMGVIGFKKSFLDQFARMPQTPLEINESVDMLRLIENNLTLKAKKIHQETLGIDVPEELARAETIMRTDPLTQRYLEPQKCR